MGSGSVAGPFFLVAFLWSCAVLQPTGLLVCMYICTHICTYVHTYGHALAVQCSCVCFAVVELDSPTCILYAMSAPGVAQWPFFSGLRWGSIHLLFCIIHLYSLYCSIFTDVQEGTRQLMLHVGSAKGIAAIRSAVHTQLSEVVRCTHALHMYVCAQHMSDPLHVTHYTLVTCDTLHPCYM